MNPLANATFTPRIRADVWKAHIVKNTTGIYSKVVKGYDLAGNLQGELPAYPFHDEEFILLDSTVITAQVLRWNNGAYDVLVDPTNQNDMKSFFLTDEKVITIDGTPVKVFSKYYQEETPQCPEIMTFRKQSKNPQVIRQLQKSNVPFQSN